MTICIIIFKPMVKLLKHGIILWWQNGFIANVTISVRDESDKNTVRYCIIVQDDLTEFKY